MEAIQRLVFGIPVWIVVEGGGKVVQHIGVIGLVFYHQGSARIHTQVAPWLLAFKRNVVFSFHKVKRNPPEYMYVYMYIYI